MKNYKNINEETKRIKSLFTEERLYGNLVGKETKILNEQFRRILKLFGDKFQYVDSLKKQFKLLGSFQEGLFDDYIKILKRGDQVDLLKSIKGKYIFELLPEKVRYDALLDYVDSIDDVAEQKEILTKISKYFDDNPSIKPKNMDEFESMFKKLGKSVDDINLEDFVRGVSKQADNSPSGILIFDPKNLSTEQKKKIIDEMGLNDKFITNKSSQEVAEDIVTQTGLDNTLGTGVINKLASNLKNMLITPAEFGKKVWNTFADLSIPFYGLRHQGGKSMFLGILVGPGVGFPMVYNLIRNGEIGWFSGWATLANDLGINKVEFIKSVAKLMGEDICNGLDIASNNKLNCERIGIIISEKVQEVMAQIEKKDFDLICNTLEKIKKNDDAFLDLLKNENINELLLNTFKDELDKPEYGIKDDVVIETIGFLTENITPLINYTIKSIYFGNKEVKNKIDNVFDGYRNICTSKKYDLDIDTTEEIKKTRKKRRKYTY